jgi:alcohol dehydrogenase (cytochrome c)
MNAPFRFAIAACLVAATAAADVTPERLLNAANEPENWLNYSSTYDNQRYSRLDEITRDNVAGLELQWIWQARSLEKFEATPLVVDGIIYTVQAPNDIVALDAATGRVFWSYHHENDPAGRTCCGMVNRGLAIQGETLFMGTIDAHLLAVDAISGQLLWKEKLADAGEFYSITMSPLVVGDKVMIGTGGGDGGARGIIAAFDVESGEELWRFYTIPGPGEPGNESWSGDSWRRGGSDGR